MAKGIGGPLYFTQAGATGRPMVFLHSTPDDHRLWMYQTARFSAWYRTIAIDLGGYGRSPAVQRGVTLDDQAIACWEAIDSVSPDPVIIQANSIGASVGTHMANQRPDRVLALVLSGTGYSTSADIMWKWVERYRKEGIGLRYPQLLDHFSAAAQKTPMVEHYARMVDSLNNLGTLESIIAMNEANARSRPRPESFYDALTMPMMIIAGAEDRTLDAAKALHKRIAHSEFAIIEKVGHACNFEAPWEYDRLCIDFLKRLKLHPG
jgi:pimeloyl-ACP methyl ester carboxylesterase